MAEKFADKDVKNGNFNNQMEFRKKSNKALVDLINRSFSFSIKGYAMFKWRSAAVSPIEEAPNVDFSQVVTKRSLWRGRNCKLMTESIPMINFGEKPSEESEISTLPSSNPPILKGMRYESLSTVDKNELRKMVFAQFLPYVVFMSGLVRKIYDETFNGIQVGYDFENQCLIFWGLSTLITPEQKNTLLRVIQHFIHLGFLTDDLGNFYHLSTGTLFNLIYDDGKKELCICFMGLYCASKLKISEEVQRELNLNAAKMAIVRNPVGELSEAINQILDVGTRLGEIVQDADVKIVMVGHSHGGMLAQAAALSGGFKAVVFNSAPLGNGTIKTIDDRFGKSTRKENANKITAFSVEGDWLTNGFIDSFCRFGRDHGLPMPTVLGVGYRLPAIEGGLKQTHCNYFDAFMALKSEQ